jgi:antitoxin (DNA-binding transcriptional repressor) of toxin-antitoxin stability system
MLQRSSEERRAVRQVSTTTARAQLASLIEAAIAGEDVVITRRSRPVARLVRHGGVKFGVLEGKVGSVPDFLEPMSEEDLALWEGRADEGRGVV